jgi:hypothetical protein
VVVALRDVDVGPAADLLGEGVPVAMGGLVRADLRRDDGEVERDADRRD